jgi:diguanylate cyclase (GGDEF)-like protein
MLFEARLSAAHRRCVYYKRIAVLFIDLNRFKHINDSLGHSGRRSLLKSIADRLKVVPTR